MLFKNKRRVWSCDTWELHKITILLFTHKVLLKKMAMSKTLVSHFAKAAMPVSDWSNERIPKVKHNYSLGCFRQPAGYWPRYFNYLSKAGVLINNTTKYHYDDLPTRQVWPLPTTKRWLIWLFPMLPRPLGETCFNTPASYLLLRSCHADNRPPQLSQKRSHPS